MKSEKVVRLWLRKKTGFSGAVPYFLSPKVSVKEMQEICETESVAVQTLRKKRDEALVSVIAALFRIFQSH